MVSMKDISKACGVSVATVSKALNDHSDIGEETKQHIRQVARQMGYSPNLSARALKTNKTHGIGVLFVDEGYIKEEGSPEEIFKNPQDAHLKDFLSKVL